MNYLKNSHVVDLVSEIQDSGKISKKRVLEITDFPDFYKIVPILDVISFAKDEDPPEGQGYNFDELSYFYKEYTNSSLVHQLCDKGFDDLVLIDIFNNISKEHIEHYRDYVLSSGESLKATLASNYCPLRDTETVKFFTDGSLRGFGLEVIDHRAHKIYEDLRLSRFVNFGKYKSLQEKMEVTLDMYFNYDSFEFDIYQKSILEGRDNSQDNDLVKKVFVESAIELASPFVPGIGFMKLGSELVMSQLTSVVDEEDLMAIASASSDSHSFDIKTREIFKKDQKFAERAQNSFCPFTAIDTLYQEVCRKVTIMREEDGMIIENDAHEMFDKNDVSNWKLAYISAYRNFTKK